MAPEDPERGRIVHLLVRCGGDPAAAAEAGLQVTSVTGDVVAGVMPLDRVEALADAPGVERVVYDHGSNPHLDVSVPATKANLVRAAPLGLTGAGVVLGVVDSGIDVFHRNFRRDDGSTRLLAYLDLTIRNTIAVATGTAPGTTFQLRWTQPNPPRNPTTQTGNLSATATAAQVRQALLGLTGITATDIDVQGGPLPTPITVDFVGRYLNAEVDALWATAVGVDVRRGRIHEPADIAAALANPAGAWASADTDGHGTHVTGTAGGDGSQADDCRTSGSFVGVAPGAEIIAVKSTLRHSEVKEGCEFIFERARTRSPQAPAVINLSIGSQMHGHDGLGYLDTLLDPLLLDAAGQPRKGRAIVVSASNDGELVDPEKHKDGRGRGGIHCAKSIAANGTATVTIHTAPSDMRSRSFEFYYRGAGRLDAQVKAPGATPTSLAVVNPGGNATGPLGGATVSVASSTGLAGGKHLVSVTIAPPSGAALPARTWEVAFTETAGTAVELDGWTNAFPDPHPRFAIGDQSRARTLGSPGTAFNVVTVGNYIAPAGKLNDSSSRGPTADGRQKPDLSAPGTNIYAPRAGEPTTGCCQGEGCCCACCTTFYQFMTGTSMASPHVAGVVALMLQRNHLLTHVEIRDKLKQHSSPPDPGNLGTDPQNSWGAGMVDAQKVIQNVTADPTAPSNDALVLPLAAYRSAYLSREERLRRLSARVPEGPAAQLAAALVSAHIDEVLRIIAHDRRAALAWHRMHGPELARVVVFDDGRRIPERLGGAPLAQGIARLLDALERAGSPALREDIARHRELVLALPGADLADLRPAA
jgi:subtilisin family serine protease